MTELPLSMPVPDNYKYTVDEYTPAHSQLYVIARNPKIATEVFYWGFVHVYYFAGPIAWTGASFRLASDDEFVILPAP
jgi:hypothetical protein